MLVSTTDGFVPKFTITPHLSTKRVQKVQRQQWSGEAATMDGQMFGSQGVSLHAIPQALPWIVGSIAGGCTGTPLVIKATESWYRDIDLPLFTPPDSVFAPVWTTLYGCIGYAGWLVRKPVGWNNLALRLYAFHYALNLLWAPLFFGLQKVRRGAGRGAKRAWEGLVVM